MRSITFSAPAKVHLLGEHSVVYGRPALLAAINRRVRVSITASSKTIGFTLKDNDFSLKRFQEVIEETIKKDFKINRIPPYSATIDSDIPIGFGLGSSAAISAAATACLLSFLNITWDKKLIFEIANAGEKLFHGNPSGGDLAVVISGGLLYFRKEFEFLKTFSPLSFDSLFLQNFILINSGKPIESTREMVEKVGMFMRRFPKRVNTIFEDQEKLTKKLVLGIKDDNEDIIMHSLKSGERNLEKLGVVSLSAKKIIKSIERENGVAKVCGAGGHKNGSGMLIAYHRDPNAISEFVKKNNFECMKVKIDQEGLRQE